MLLQNNYTNIKFFLSIFLSLKCINQRDKIFLEVFIWGENMKKKIWLGILVGSILCFNTSFAYTKIYDMKSTEIPVSSGVTYRNLKRLTTEGWLNINILKVDLANKYIKLDMLTSAEGLYTLDTVKNQAIANDAVAAVNADFFSWDGKTNGYPVGFTMRDGKITSSAYYKNVTADTMASLLLTSNKSPLYGYIKMEEMKISNDKGESMNIAEINKISSDYLTPVIFTPEFGKNSPGNSKLWDMVEFVVEDGKLKEIRDCMEGAVIPENGYVICARLDNAYLIKCMFVIGDEVTIDIKTNIAASDVSTAISGGGLLVSNGNILTTHSHNISGYQPRTAIGTSEDGETLYMVAVDGRGISKGVTQIELAYLMAEIGCYDAINFDGGGSTYMVGRLAGTDYLSTLNVPTENRKVVNSLGVISTAPKSGDVENLIIEANYDTIFKGYETELKVSAYDEYINKVNVNQDDVKWKITGVKGGVKNGIFKPTTSGDAKLTATYKGVSHDIDIKVLGDIGEIDLGSREITLAKGQTYILPIVVKDLYGYMAPYKAQDLSFTVSNANCSVDENAVVTANEIGSTLITVLSDNNTAKSFVKVNVTGEYEEVINEFEELNTSFRGYPSEVDGELELSTTKHSGKKSIKLSYDFSGIDATRAAYVVFDTPIEISQNTIGINFWAYSKRTQNNVMLKIQVTDKEGEEKLLEVSKEIEKGWNKYEISLDNIILPGTLDRIYVAQVADEKTADSYINIDDLVFIKKGETENSAIILPNNTKPMDLAEREEDLDTDGFRFMFCGDIIGEGTLYDTMKTNRLNNIASDLEFCILGNGELSNAKEQIIINGKYSFTEKGEVAVLKLANKGKGLLSTYTEQWGWFVDKLNGTNAKNLLIVMPEEVNESFSDELEKKLFKQVLEEYEEKNDAKVTFLVLGEESTFSMYEGTKTLFAGNRIYNTPRARMYHDKYILFTSNGEELTYQILNVF